MKKGRTRNENQTEKDMEAQRQGHTCREAEIGVTRLYVTGCQELPATTRGQGTGRGQSLPRRPWKEVSLLIPTHWSSGLLNSWGSKPPSLWYFVMSVAGNDYQCDGKAESGRAQAIPGCVCVWVGEAYGVEVVTVHAMAKEDLPENVTLEHRPGLVPERMFQKKRAVTRAQLGQGCAGHVRQEAQGQGVQWSEPRPGAVLTEAAGAPVSQELSAMAGFGFLL